MLNLDLVVPLGGEPYVTGDMAHFLVDKIHAK